MADEKYETAAGDSSMIGDLRCVRFGEPVALHFSLSLSDGAIVDSTFDKTPARCVIGDGSLLPGFEKIIMGLKSGDKRSVIIEPENGFGLHNEENVHKMKRSCFDAGLQLAIGLLVSFSDGQNDELPGLIIGMTDDYVDVDFNHPLAGKDIIFSVEILDVPVNEQPVVLQPSLESSNVK